MEKSYKVYLHQITTFIFDVDGVLTDGSLHITTDGQLHRTMNTKDGYAMKTALQQGFNLCIISGGTDEGVRSRLNTLGIADVYLGAHHKVEQLDEYLSTHNINPEHVLSVSYTHLTLPTICSV